MSDGKSGHTATIGIEKVGDAAGTFTSVAKLTNDLPFPNTREVVSETPHGDTINTRFIGPMETGEVPLEGHFLYDHATHDHLTGLQKHYADGDKFGIQWRGPSGASNTDEIIASGFITAFERIAPRGAGPYRFTATFAPSGPIIIDGVTIGSVL